MTDIGHNTVAAEELKAFIDRIERLSEEKEAISSDIKDVITEAGSRGYDKKALRTIVALRKKDADKRAEEEHILNVYMKALGMQIEMFPDE